MSKAPGSWLLAWGVASALLLTGCHQPVATPTPAQPTPTTGSGLQPSGATEEALVTDIVDGDTIRVEIDGVAYRVRYIGIDAPEVARDNYPGEPLSADATQANADLVEGEIVILESDTSDTDDFGRLLRYVWLQRPSGWLFVNEELVRQGLADARRYPPDTARQDVLQQAEDAAKDSDLGIWAN